MRRLFHGRKATIVVTLLAAALFTTSFAVPALGGPSIGSIAKTAKKALRTGKLANSRAVRAGRTATTALNNAATAQGTANTALTTANGAQNTANGAAAGPRVTAVSQRDVYAAPFDFARFDVRCPAGTVAVGIGLGLGALEPVFFASYGGGAIVSMFNPSDTTSYSGSVWVECVQSSGYAGAAGVRRMTRSAALREAGEQEQEKVQAAR